MGSRAVAIDIGSSMVRVADLELANGADPRDGATLHSYAERPTPAGVVKDGQVAEPGALAQVVKQTVAAAKPGNKRFVVGIGHPSVVVREVDIPAQHMDKVRESLAFHVQDQLPMAPSEAVLDFYPTSEYEAQAGPTLRGLLVASPRELIRDIVAVLDQAGISVTAIDHSALGLWRAGSRGPLLERSVAFVDVGASHSLVAVSQQGAPRLVRALPQGSDDATRGVAAAVSGQGVDPESLKREIGMDPSATGSAKLVADAVSHSLTPLIEAIRNTLVYVSSSTPGGGVERIVLTGGGARTRGFGQAVASATRLPVSIGEPTAGLRLGRRVDPRVFQGRELELATVVGLAMGGQK